MPKKPVQTCNALSLKPIISLLPLGNPLLLAAAVVAIIIGGGCVRHDEVAPETKDHAIEFEAGSMLLKDKPTKTSGRMVGSDFIVGDSFYAWAWHDGASQYMTFNPVVKGSIDWDYDSHLYWNWRGVGDYYDFLAIYPASSISSDALTAPSPTPQTQASRLLKATVDYEAFTSGIDPRAGQYDLMAAGYRRDENGLVTPVDLIFRRMLSAVCVDVKNSASSLDPITLKSCHFVNLVTHSTIAATFTGSNTSSGLNIDTGVPSRSNDPVLGPSIPSNKVLDTGHSLYIDRLVQTLSSLSESNALVQTLAGHIYEDRVWDMTADEQGDWADDWIDDTDNASLLESLSIDSDVFKANLTAALTSLADPEDWDLMIPQNLNLSGASAPTIEVVYNNGEDDITQSVTLKDIKNQSNVAITSWESGVKYRYILEMRIGVGVVVTVKTTPWDVVEAETPGLMID